ncbi:unnamed protein product [Miscanthus lutarioriparius]|uniref:Splicing factor Cactin C-terminal domain-containing protein n=1 Tax=Miscanthus lutarioriparius TaxID=422564 RepID=A0A811S4M3_9POAL|nr:unnamed protein product [Miscanthus lutarioriparius]
MRSGTAKVVEYWEAILKQRLITVILYNLELRYCIELLNFDFAVYTYEKYLFASQACLREIHASILRKHLHRLEHPDAVEQDVESEKEDDNKLEDEMHEDEDDKRYSPEPIPQHTENQFEEEDVSFSPQLMHGNEDEDAIDPKEDKAELDRKREAVVLEHQRKVQKAMKAKARVPDEMEMKAIKTMGAMEEGDAVFGAGAEVNLDSQVYWWHDKYRPRKPKYFNRVHTGYEWNKYN